MTKAEQLALALSARVELLHVVLWFETAAIAIAVVGIVYLARLRS